VLNRKKRNTTRGRKSKHEISYWCLPGKAMNTRIQYAPPPSTAPLVDMAHIERIVIKIMRKARPNWTSVSMSPA